MQKARTCERDDLVYADRLVRVGIAMFAIPVANELLGGSTAAEWVLVIIAGVCMTASAYFGIKSLTLISYIAVPLVAILGTVAW